MTELEQAKLLAIYRKYRAGKPIRTDLEELLQC